MKGDNHLLALTTKTITAADDPSLAEGEVRVEPLFAFPVQVCKATETRKSPFDIAAPSGAERKQVYLDTATGEMVEDADCLRGVRMGDEFRSIPAEAITEAKGQKTNMMVALGTVDLPDVDFTRTEATYFVQSPAKGGSAKAYRLTYEALRPIRVKGKVTQPARAIVVKRTPRTNERLAVVYADEQRGCLMLTHLHFAEDVRQPDAQVLAPQQAEVTEQQIEMACKVIDNLGDGKAVLDTATDENAPRITALIEKAIAGEAIKAPTPIAVTVEQDDLEAQLLASLA